MKYQQLLMDFGRSVMRRVRAKPDDLAKPRRNSRLRHDPLLEDFANQLLKAAGCRHLKVRVFWNPSLRTTAGMAMWSDRMVVLNPKLVEVSAAEVQRTLRHELATFSPTTVPAVVGSRPMARNGAKPVPI